MLNIALIIVNLLNVYPQDLWDSVPSFQTPEVVISFQDSPAIQSGDPVVYRGRLVGRVTSLQIGSERVGENEKISKLTVALSKDRQHLIKNGVSAISSSHYGGKKKRPVHFVELLGTVSEDGAEPLDLSRPIAGYSSNEKFWRPSAT